MLKNADYALSLILSHEGGWSDHPRDPGGPTNRGVTIGTLRSLGMDLDGDGDGDVDVHDLRLLTAKDAAAIFKRFYWDKVDGDYLPSGVDYTVADFAVNSGPRRATEYLQNALGVEADGDIGPITMTALSKAHPPYVITAINAARLAYLKRLKTWNDFGNGWTVRVQNVNKISLEMAGD